MNPENFPDKTHSELLEDNHGAAEEIAEDIEDEAAEMHATGAAIGAAIVFSRMFEDDAVTFREYIRLTNWVEEYEREHGMGRL
jgi:hypothetical protein